MNTEEKEAEEEAEELRRAAPAGAQPAAVPDRGRRLRHRPGRSDHQPDRRGAAEHRHRPAAQRLAGRAQATRRPTSAATSSRRWPAVPRTAGRQPSREPVQPVARRRPLLPQRRFQPRRAEAPLPRRSVPDGRRASSRSSPRRTPSTRAKSSASTAWSRISRLNAAVNFPGGGAPAANYATYTWNFGDGTTDRDRLRTRARRRLRSAVAEPLRRQRLPHLHLRRHLRGDADGHRRRRQRRQRHQPGRRRRPAGPRRSARRAARRREPAPAPRLGLRGSRLGDRATRAAEPVATRGRRLHSR